MGGKLVSTWNGDQLLDKIEKAAVAAINETADAGRDDARASHPWKIDPKPRKLKSGRRVDTHLEHQIESEHAAAVAADGHARAHFGYTRRAGFVGLFHEEGTVHEHAYPTIRPAADRQAPTFIERLRRRLG